MKKIFIGFLELLCFIFCRKPTHNTIMMPSPVPSSVPPSLPTTWPPSFPPTTPPTTSVPPSSVPPTLPPTTTPPPDITTPPPFTEPPPDTAPPTSAPPSWPPQPTTPATTPPPWSSPPPPNTTPPPTNPPPSHNEVLDIIKAQVEETHAYTMELRASLQKAQNEIVVLRQALDKLFTTITNTSYIQERLTYLTDHTLSTIEYYKN